MKVVCDTNIYISFLKFGGKAEILLEHAFKGEFDLVISPEIIKETADVLKKKFGWDNEKVSRSIMVMTNASQVVKPTKKIEKIKTDKSDNKILECAVEGKADYIVTGDKKHLLPLKKFKGIPIYSPQEFLKQVLYN